jgi:hypothetical protein
LSESRIALKQPAGIVVLMTPETVVASGRSRRDRGPREDQLGVDAAPWIGLAVAEAEHGRDFLAHTKGSRYAVARDCDARCRSYHLTHHRHALVIEAVPHRLEPEIGEPLPNERRRPQRVRCARLPPTHRIMRKGMQVAGELVSGRVGGLTDRRIGGLGPASTRARAAGRKEQRQRAHKSPPANPPTRQPVYLSGNP